MDKTKIDWCDSTWNPVTGCLHGCEYCYARGIANRFGGANDGDIDAEGETIWTFNGESTGKTHILDKPFNWCNDDGSIIRKAAYPYYFDPTFYRYKLNDYQKKYGRNIFVCAMADLFGEWVPDSWIEEVFEACGNAPQHNYLFLTKNPFRYELLHQKKILRMNENMWYGYSYTKPGTDYWYDSQYKIFASIEPILEPLAITPPANWIIIGAETGRRKDKVVPKREWIEKIVEDCRKSNTPVFMKSSLAEIWGEPLIHEFPEGLKR